MTIVLLLTLDHYIIHVGLHNNDEYLLEQYPDHPLKCCHRVPQAKRHDDAAVHTVRREECGFLCIIQVLKYLMIALECVHEVEQLATCCFVHQQIDPQHE
ncbi:unnamed protein product, partial [Cuscuta epithymum]